MKNFLNAKFGRKTGAFFFVLLSTQTLYGADCGPLEPDGLPEGSYKQSCGNCELDPNSCVLSCDNCEISAVTSHKGRRSSHSNISLDLRTCGEVPGQYQYDIANIEGELKCP